MTEDEQEALELREEIARIAAPMMEGGREFDQCPPDRIALRKWNREGMCSINDATQDDALTLADAILPIITRERERAAMAALEAAKDAKIAELERECDTLSGLVQGWHYLAVGPDEMGDYYTQKQLIKASAPYASPALAALETKHD